MQPSTGGWKVINYKRLASESLVPGTRMRGSTSMAMYGNLLLAGIGIGIFISVFRALGQMENMEMENSHRFLWLFFILAVPIFGPMTFEYVKVGIRK
jgi:flagellar biosynthesis protein FliQ